MTPLTDLDTTVARLDLAIIRVCGLPDDPVAAHELAFCLNALASQHLPSGLGPELDGLLQQAMHLARKAGPSFSERPPAILQMQLTPLAKEVRCHLRSKLLDIAAAISVLSRD